MIPSAMRQYQMMKFPRIEEKQPMATTTMVHRAGEASAEWDRSDDEAPRLILGFGGDDEAEWTLTEKDLSELLEVLRAAVAEEEARRSGATGPVADKESSQAMLEAKLYDANRRLDENESAARSVHTLLEHHSHIHDVRQAMETLTSQWGGI